MVHSFDQLFSCFDCAWADSSVFFCAHEVSEQSAVCDVLCRTTKLLIAISSDTVVLPAGVVVKGPFVH